MNEFKVGDKVTIHTHYGTGTITQLRVVTVTALSPRKLTLSDGSSWNAHGGRPYGCKSMYYTRDSVHPYKDGDEELVYRRRLLTTIQKIEDTVWQKLTTAELKSVWEVLRKYRDVVVTPSK